MAFDGSVGPSPTYPYLSLSTPAPTTTWQVAFDVSTDGSVGPQRNLLLRTWQNNRPGSGARVNSANKQTFVLEVGSE